MHFSFLRAFQWTGIAVVLAVLVGLNYDFESDAKMQMNSAIEDPLSQSLLGYWKMDEGTGTSTTADSSGNATTLTMTVMESGDWVTGQIGPYSLDFDGTAEYLTVADPAILDFADGASFSLTGWFNRDLAANDDTIIAKKTNQTTNVGYTVWIDNNASTDYLFFEASDGTDTYQIQSTTDFSTTGWHHFAITWNDNSSLTTPVNLYIDGALNNGTTSGTFDNVGDLSASNTNAFRIGAESGTADNFFDGKLDDIRIYSSPLSASDVSKLYQTTAPAQPVDTNLVGHWTFDGPDIQETTAMDRSGKGNNGTMTGTTKTIGKLGQGLSFDFSTSKVTTTQALSTLISNSTVTLSAWVKPGSNFDASGAPNYLACIVCDTDYLGIFRGQYTGIGRDALFVFNYDGSNDVQVADTGSVPIGTWAHVALVHSGGNLYGYYNGSLVGSVASGNTQSLAQTFLIGGNIGYFDGSIDDVRVYNRALSITEIANLYNTGK